MSEHHMIKTFFKAARSSARPSIAKSGPWVWPLPSLNGRAPVVLDRQLTEALDPKDTLLNRPRILLVYDRGDFADQDCASVYPAGTFSGSLFHFLPRFTPVFAAQAGAIVYADRDGDNGVLTVDHGNGWATHYANLEYFFAATRQPDSRKRAEKVSAGDVLGYAGGSCLVKGSMRPLRFELWRKLPEDGGLYRAEDPLPRMKEWIHLPLIEKVLEAAGKKAA